MRLVFWGTAEFGLPTLQAIANDARHDLAAVVTGPDKARGRGRQVGGTPVASWAQQHGLAPILKPEHLGDPEFVAALRASAADVYAVVAYRILPESVFTIPRYAFNLHASLLPAYRGAAPIQRAIMAGETTTGVTTFLLQKTVDTGSIVAQRETAILPEENAGQLAERLAALGAELVMETLDILARGAVHAHAQENARASTAPKITPADRPLDFTLPAGRLINHVRALAPAPGAVAGFHQGVMKVLALRDAGPMPARHSPGEVVSADAKTGLRVAACDRMVSVELIQPPGKRVLTGAEFVRGYRIQPGDRFSPVTSDALS